MKKVIFYILFFLLICNKLMAYELSCSYKWNEEKRHFFWEIKGNKVTSRSTTHQKIIDEDIIKEEDNHLYFGQTVYKGDVTGFRLSILDLETLKFRIVALNDPRIEKQSTDIIEGFCNKVN